MVRGGGGRVRAPGEAPAPPRRPQMQRRSEAPDPRGGARSPRHRRGWRFRWRRGGSVATASGAAPHSPGEPRSEAAGATGATTRRGSCASHVGGRLPGSIARHWPVTSCHWQAASLTTPPLEEGLYQAPRWRRAGGRQAQAPSPTRPPAPHVTTRDPCNAHPPSRHARPGSVCTGGDGHAGHAAASCGGGSGAPSSAAACAAGSEGGGLRMGAAQSRGPRASSGMQHAGPEPRGRARCADDPRERGPSPR